MAVVKSPKHNRLKNQWIKIKSSTLIDKSKTNKTLTFKNIKPLHGYANVNQADYSLADKVLINSYWVPPTNKIKCYSITIQC